MSDRNTRAPGPKLLATAVICGVNASLGSKAASDLNICGANCSTQNACINQRWRCTLVTKLSQLL